MTYTGCHRSDISARTPWAIVVHGGIIGTYKKRSQAISVAKVLAGWRGQVIAEGKGK